MIATVKSSGFKTWYIVIMCLLQEELCGWDLLLPTHDLLHQIPPILQTGNVVYRNT